MGIVEDVGGGIGKSGELRPCYYWNIFVADYARKDVEDGLAKELEGVGLRRGLIRKSRFKGEGIEIRLEIEKGVRVRIRVDLYAASNATKLEETRKTIQDEVNNQASLIMKRDYGYYDDKGDSISYTINS